MMTNTNFAKLLTGFLSNYLPMERGMSINTISSYKDTFILFIKYMEYIKIKINRITLEVITMDIVVDFLDWLQATRKCCNSTRNLRLAAIHSFFKYIQYQYPENLLEMQRILSIPNKKEEKKSFNYLSLNGISLLLRQPNTSNSRGRRDLALLSLMYDTGCRVQELIDLTPSDIRFNNPITICIKGKGNKSRIVPMLDRQVNILKEYMIEYKLLEPQFMHHPLFFNSQLQKFTRAGINYILHKYIVMATKVDSTLIPDRISCHSLRHSKAIHLLQSNVNLIYIRDLLGHTSITTTEIYARADSSMKRRALENAFVDVKPDQIPSWLVNDDLLEWLKSF